MGHEDSLFRITILYNRYKNGIENITDEDIDLIKDLDIKYIDKNLLAHNIYREFERRVARLKNRLIVRDQNLIKVLVEDPEFLQKDIIEIAKYLIKHRISISIDDLMLALIQHRNQSREIFEVDNWFLTYMESNKDHMDRFRNIVDMNRMVVNHQTWNDYYDKRPTIERISREYEKAISKIRFKI